MPSASIWEPLSGSEGSVSVSGRSDSSESLAPSEGSVGRSDAGGVWYCRRWGVVAQQTAREP